MNWFSGTGGVVLASRGVAQLDLVVSPSWKGGGRWGWRGGGGGLTHLQHLSRITCPRVRDSSPVPLLGVVTVTMAATVNI